MPILKTELWRLTESAHTMLSESSKVIFTK
uniref:Uncharacterized protein n=1 Tax=Arundo donax TaxID=35708 RepID=A0A0A9H436_ARUDO